MIVERVHLVTELHTKTYILSHTQDLPQQDRKHMLIKCSETTVVIEVTTEK